MPGVTVLPNSPRLSGFGSPQLDKTTPTLLPHQTNTAPASHRRDHVQNNEVDLVAIKEHAISLVRKEALGTSSSNMLAVALKQYSTGRDHEVNGELAEAYKHFVMAASLVKKAMDHPDAERVSLYAGMDVALKTDLREHLKSVEEELRTSGPAPSLPENASVASIAERKKALEGNGLSLGSHATLKRLSPAISESTPPSSPRQISTRVSTRASIEATSPKSGMTPAPSSPLTVVSSSLSPSRPTSPIATFSQSFPTIEELEAPFNVTPIDTTTHSKSLPNGILFPTQIEKTPSLPGLSGATPFLNQPRSSANASSSRPASTLSIFSSSTISQQPNIKPIIPVSGTTTADELLEYFDHHKILLLDVRNRSDFYQGHIEYKGAAVACVEPSIFRDENLTISELEQAMTNAPSEERSVFSNRDKFEIVVLYDNHSKDLGASNTPLSILNRLIATARNSQKLLKRQPMLLVGGYNAWRRAFSSDVSSTILSDNASSITTSPPLSRATSPPLSRAASPPLSRTASKNPFYVNGLASPPRSYGQGYVPVQTPNNTPVHGLNPSLDYGFGHTWFPAEALYNSYPPISGVLRLPAIAQQSSSSSSSVTGSSENLFSPVVPQSGFPSPFSYPSLTQTFTPVSGIASPPQASIKSSPLSRKRQDYDDPSQDAVSHLRSRTHIAYPPLSNSPMPQPPPPVASSTLERQESRPRLPATAGPGLAPGLPRTPSSSVSPIQYSAESSSPVCGLNNLGNTCYMNATLQCLYATPPFLDYFKDHRWQGSINTTNPLGSRGLVTRAFESVLSDMRTMRESSIKEKLEKFLDVIRSRDRQYEGHNQHDSQEFLTFLLDKMHEDLNQIKNKPPTEPTLTPEQEYALESRDPRTAIDEEWSRWRKSNDSIIVDLFQGQFRSLLRCSICQRPSTTYNAFSILQLPIPSHLRGTIHLQDCLDHLFRTEELQGDNRWDCPSCKTKRNATQRLSLARLPPILLIHLKRFQTSGTSAGKIDTFVHCPLRNLEFRASPDMPDDPRGDPSRDPQAQVGPYRYDLYAVTNHHGQMNSGHYTAHVESNGDWYQTSDLRTSKLTGPVVTNEAYVLFYKRVNT